MQEIGPLWQAGWSAKAGRGKGGHQQRRCIKSRQQRSCGESWVPHWEASYASLGYNQLSDSSQESQYQGNHIQNIPRFVSKNIQVNIPINDQLLLLTLEVQVSEWKYLYHNHKMFISSINTSSLYNSVYTGSAATSWWAADRDDIQRV